METEDRPGPEGTAILILGAAVWPGGRPSPTLRRRALHAAALWRRGVAARVVPCGGLGRYPPSEAAVMKRLLVEDGIPEAAILCEDRSTSTRENILFAREILEGHGVARVILVSDGYHLPRARLIARRAGLVATGSSPGLRGARLWPQIKGTLREVAAYLATLLGVLR